MRPVRLLAIIEAESITGPAKNLLQFAKLVRSRETNVAIEPAIGTFVRAGRESNLFVNAVRAASVPLFEIPEQGRFDRSVIPVIRNIVGQFRPDIIQSHAVKSHFVVRASGCHKSVPWIAFHHGYTWPDLRARIYNGLDRWSLRAAARAVTMSRPFADQLVARGVRRDLIDVVHNAVDPEWGSRYRSSAAALRAKLNIPEGAAAMLIVGRLSREKDHITLLRAMKMASGAVTRPLHLVMVGDGPERPRIEAEILQLGLTSQVSLAGHQPSAEPYYPASDIGVLSSLTEGSPNALLEAMAAGLPVVATSVGGIPEIAADGESALLVPARDVSAMSAAIVRLVNYPETARTIAVRAREIVLFRHTPEARVQQLAGIYNLVSGHLPLMAAGTTADGNFKDGTG